MKRILFSLEIAVAMLVLLIFPSSITASEDIYSLRIENINRSGADFRWSTSIETKGTIEYAYAKLPELYNPQKPGTSATIIMTVTPLQIKSETNYVKEHHVKIDNLDINYDPFIQYTIKSETFNGDIYSISGEFVLVNIKVINWWQTWMYALFMPLTMFVLGQIIRPTILLIREYLRKRATSRKDRDKN